MVIYNTTLVAFLKMIMMPW